MFDDLLAGLPADPPRSLDLLPGLRMRTAVSPVLLAPFGGILFFLVLMGSIVFTQPQFRMLLGQAAAIEGTVVSRGDCRAAADSVVRYAFTPPNGPEYHGSYSDCRGSTSAGLQPGDKAAITYLVSDPSVNALAERFPGRGEPPLLLFLLFSLFPAVFLLPIVLSPLLEVLRNRRIARRGLLVKGTVRYAASGTRPLGPSVRNYGVAEIFIAYRHPNGQMVEARAKCRNAWLLNQLVPGSSVTIAYLPDQPAVAVLLDAFLR
jgi:hypothetical protein